MQVRDEGPASRRTMAAAARAAVCAASGRCARQRGAGADRALAPIATAASNRAIVDRFADAPSAWRLAGSWELLLIVATALSPASTWVTFRIGRTVAAGLANAVFERIVRQSPRYHARQGISDAHMLLGCRRSRRASASASRWC
jgi:hypothetical protein